jgi:hypothetical protein
MRNALDDLSDGMAELAESHREIEHRHIPNPSRGNADVPKEIVDRHRHQHPGQNGEQPGDHTLIVPASVEVISERMDVTQIPAINGIARRERGEPARSTR